MDERREASAYEFTWQLAHKQRVEPATYARAADAFDDHGLVDMVLLIGLYLTTCSIINGLKFRYPKAGSLAEASLTGAILVGATGFEPVTSAV